MDRPHHPLHRQMLTMLCSLTLHVGHAQAGTRIHFVHNDHLGTPQALTNNEQTVVWRATYKPFGEADINEDADNDGEKLELNLRFPGQYHDPATNLYYNYYRDYDPRWGRYVQSDPIGLGGGISTYGYAYQNPLTNIDPEGLLVANAVSGAVGAVLGGYSAYSSTGSIGETIEATIIGGLSNFVSGKALFNAANNIVGNLASQVDAPCFDGFNYRQAAAAGVLGAYNLGSRLPQPNLLSSTSVIAHTAATQKISGYLIGLL